MICKGKTKDGRLAFSGRHEDLKAVTKWVRCLLHLSYGEEEGEQRFQKIRLVDALSLWGRSKIEE